MLSLLLAAALMVQRRYTDRRVRKTPTLFAPPKIYSFFRAKINPITFKSAHANLPLPNPARLRIHAACCNIAHLSGAGKYMSRMSQDLEDTQVLVEDGSSADVLSFALQPHS